IEQDAATVAHHLAHGFGDLADAGPAAAANIDQTSVWAALDDQQRTANGIVDVEQVALGDTSAPDRHLGCSVPLAFEEFAQESSQHVRAVHGKMVARTVCIGQCNGCYVKTELTGVMLGLHLG